MLRQKLKSDSQAGFTLVELAIVMIIIGLLIGGVLKGQELVANAQVTSTISQIKSIDAATTTFRDIYGSLPGDLTNPTVRLPNCLAGTTCGNVGNGDGRVLTGAPFTGVPAGELLGYWAHLNQADLFTGINPNAVVPMSWGGNFPAGKIGGGFHAGYFAGGAALPNAQLAGAAAAGIRAGLYLGLHNTANGAVDNAGFLTPSQGARIDAKVDDNVPGTGSVIAAGAAGCVAAGPSRYQETNNAATCNLYIRIQN